MLHIFTAQNSYGVWPMYDKHIGNYLLYPNKKSQFNFVI